MSPVSAGMLLYRRRGTTIEVLLAHPGGPFWARKDDGAWSIPKGELEPGEAPLTAARREFREELGADPPDGPVLDLGEAVQPSRKRVLAFAAEGEFEPAALASNSFETEWPPRSGRRASFPEIDRVAWFGEERAREKILRGQAIFLDRLALALGADALSPGRSRCRTAPARSPRQCPR